MTSAVLRLVFAHLAPTRQVSRRDVSNLAGCFQSRRLRALQARRRLRRSAVGDAGTVRCWVAVYTVNQDGNPVKLRPRLMGSEDSSRPQLLVAVMRNVRLAVSRCYEDPVLVDQHDHVVQARARRTSTSFRTTAASTLRGERWPLSRAVGIRSRDQAPQARRRSGRPRRETARRPRGYGPKFGTEALRLRPFAPLRKWSNGRPDRLGHELPLLTLAVRRKASS
jgi:hypothetical protein